MSATPAYAGSAAAGVDADESIATGTQFTCFTVTKVSEAGHSTNTPPGAALTNVSYYY